MEQKEMPQIQEVHSIRGQDQSATGVRRLSKPLTKNRMVAREKNANLPVGRRKVPPIQEAH